MRRRIAFSWTGFALTALLGLNAQAAVIDISTELLPNGFENNFGKDPLNVDDVTEIFGQTFTAPSDNVLTDFKFWVGVTAGNSLTVVGKIYNGSLSGAVLSPSLSSQTFAPGTDVVTNTALFVLPGGLALTAGATYVASLEAVGPGTQETFQGRVGLGTGPGAGTGTMVTRRLAGDGVSFVDQIVVDKDLRFLANFSSSNGGGGGGGGTNNSVPEPSSWAMFGLMGIGLVYRSIRTRNAK